MTDLADLLPECTYRNSRSSGPGGQHANKVESQVTLCFDPGNSQILSPAQQHIIQSRLAHRLNQSGQICLSSQQSRSQHQNKEQVQQRFLTLIDWALTPPKPRKKTRPSRKAKEKRLDQKRRRSEKKQWRKSPDW